MLYRKAYDKLLAWKNQTKRKALCILGARQIGKTTVIRQFGNDHYECFIEINFITDADAGKIFDGNLDANTIITNLTAYTRKTMLPGKTLVLLDEIQACPNARTAIKFLVEDGRFDYIESGSLLGVKAKIYRVDYNNNLQDEGSDVYTPIYTDESWSALAAALYAAEVVNTNDNATDDEIDAAIMALETAEKALQRRVYYIPYEYNAQLYYLAISDETDTYGKWYDNQFKRIISDKTILDLDAYAEKAQIADIEQNRYIPFMGEDENERYYISPWIEIRDDLFQELRGEEVIAIQWETDDKYLYQGSSDSQIAAFTNLYNQGKALQTAGVEDPELSSALDNALAHGAYILIEGVYNTCETLEEEIARLQSIIDAINYVEPPEVDPAEEPMTLDQRTVLTAAVNAAMAIPGYDDATKTELNNLRTAVAAAQALISEDATPTMAEANTALNDLNTLMVAAGGKEVTAYNTLIHTLPVGSERFDVVYAVDQPTVPMVLTGEWGVSTVSAVVLTRSGILFTVEVPVEVYSPAASMTVVKPATLPAGGTLDADGVWNGDIYAGNTVKLGTALYARRVDAQYGVDENGDRYIINPRNLEVEKYVDAAGSIQERIVFPVGEQIKSTVWASSNTNVATVEADGTVTAKAEGTVTITVSVTTAQGNTYSTSINIIISVDPDAPVEDPTEPE